VSQVRITDIEKRKMHVIVGEDQLSLAIGKKGQNVRLATRLVGWDIDIVSEEVLKKEIALQMGRMMASGEAVPITALEGVNANQADILAAKGIDDVEKLASSTIDDLVDYLDVTFDEAQEILRSAQAIVAAKDGTGTEESVSGDEGSLDTVGNSDDPSPDEGAAEPSLEVEETEIGENEVAETEVAETEVVEIAASDEEAVDVEGTEEPAEEIEEAAK